MILARKQTMCLPKSYVDQGELKRMYSIFLNATFAYGHSLSFFL